MEIIRLDLSLVQQAADVYSRVFFDYPQFVCYHPNRDWRTQHFTDYCEVGLRFALRYGEVYSTPDIKGLIGWFAPGLTHFTTWMYLKIPGFLHQAILIGWKNLSRITACEDYAAKVHGEIMPGPHWYLWGLGVDLDRQGQGIGTQLMEPGLTRADQQGLPTYLETHDEQNIAYYQKRGFELVRSERVPSIDLPFWCLVHQPKS
jgi:GNAT superfamily N-acetyltransferase